MAGFLGSHLAEICVANGHKVSGCDNMVGGYLDNVPEGAEFRVADCTDFDAMKRLTEGADVVYHCAATPYEGLSSFSPVLVTKNIYMASVCVVTAAISNSVRRFVFCSSMARYGTNEVPFAENMPLSPQDPYGIAKVASESTIINLAETHGFEYVIAVPHNIIGPRQKYDDPYRNVAAIMINMMLQGRQPIIYGDGTQKRCFSFVQDVAPYLYRLAFEDNVVGEVINLGPDEEFVTINELAAAIADLLDFHLEPRYVADRPREVYVATCSADKARRLLGYETTYSLRDGLIEMIAWIREKGPKPFEYHLDLELITDKTPNTWTQKLF